MSVPSPHAARTPNGEPERARPRKDSASSIFFSWKALVGLAISGVFLYFTFRDQNLSAVLNEIRRADPLLLLIAVALATLIFWMRAWRWRYILDPVHEGTAFKARFAGVAIGAMGNNLLPARIGEFARAYAFSRIQPVSVVAAFSSLVIERMFDALFLVGLLFFAMVTPGFPNIRVAEGAIYVNVARTLGVLLAIAFATLFLLVLWPDRVVRLLERASMKVLPAKLRRLVVDALEAFLAGVSILRDPRLVLHCAIWSAAIWFVNSLAFWVAFHAFGMSLPVSAAVFFNSCLALAVSVPSGPAFIGPYQAASTFVLVNLFGQDANRALAFAVGFHLAGFLPVTLIGLYYANRIGLSLGGMARTEEEVEAAVEKETGIDPGRTRRPN